MSPAPTTPDSPPPVSREPGSTSCWNCGQDLPAGTPRCLYCGVPQDAQSARLVIAPHGVVGAPPPLVAPPTSSAPGSPPVGNSPSAGPGVAPWDASPLGTAFAGTPAGAGLRLGAFTIDVAAVSLVMVAVGLWTSSPLLAALVGAELWIGLWVVQARTGLGLGKALLRLRVSRIEEPFSPGVGRAFVRGAVTAAGALALLVGAWVVEASAAWDRSGLRRSWADRASGTVVVAVPPRVAGAPRRTRAVTRGASAAGAGEAAIAPPQVSAPAPVIAPVQGGVAAFGQSASASERAHTASAISAGSREPAAEQADEFEADAAPPTQPPGISPLEVPALPPEALAAPSAPAFGFPAPGAPGPTASSSATPLAAEPASRRERTARPVAPADERAPGPRRTPQGAAPQGAAEPVGLSPATPPSVDPAAPSGDTPAASGSPATPLAPPRPQTPPPLSLGEPQRRVPSGRPRVDRAGVSATGAPGARRSSAVPLDEADAAVPRRRSSSEVPTAADLEPSALEGMLLLIFDTGQREQLPIPVAANLGRNPAASEPSDLLISVRDPDSTVSKTHLRLEHSRSGTWVTDAGSTNGTDLLDEEGRITPLSAGVRTLIEDGVRVRLGNRVFTVNRLIGAS